MLVEPGPGADIPHGPSGTPVVRRDGGARARVGTDRPHLGFGEHGLVVVLPAWCALALRLVPGVLPMRPIVQV